MKTALRQEDLECPLCLEEMDITDVNFKPCVCGYQASISWCVDIETSLTTYIVQICRFCWNHIKENLNGRCPACRREYTEESVQFQPISKEE